MSKLMTYFMLSAATVVLVACGNDGGGGGGDTIGTTPADCLAKGNCADLSAYGPQYAYQRGADNRYVGWNTGYRQNFCGCGPGYRPASTIRYDSLSCIPVNSVPDERRSQHGSMMSIDPLIATWNPGTFSFSISYVVTPFGAAVGYQAGWSGPMVATGLAPHISYQRDEYGTPYGTTRNNGYTNARYNEGSRPWASAPRNSFQPSGNKCYSNVAITCHEVNRGADCGVSANGRYRRCLPVSGLPRGIGVCSKN